MDIKNIIKNSLIKEVGEGGHQPFRSKKSHERGETDDFTYVFKTKNGWEYTVSLSREWGKSWWHEKQTEKEWRDELASIYHYDRKKYVNLRKMGADRNDLRGIWTVGFSAEEPEKPIQPKDNTEGERKNWNDTMWEDHLGSSDWRSQFRSNFDDTDNKEEFYRVMSTISKIVKDHIEKHGGRILTFVPYDERRGRVFTHFIMRQIPGSKLWIDGNEFYFFLNVKKK